MSNDSNEPGNDTAACGVCGASLINGACEWCDAAKRAVQSTLQAAFQVGDRVRWVEEFGLFQGHTRMGVIAYESIIPGKWAIDVLGGQTVVDASALTLISRATPAPAQSAPPDDDDDIAFSLFCHTQRHEQCHNADCGCSCHDATPAPLQQPATPAPAATPPALDTHTLELPVRIPCEPCHATGVLTAGNFEEYPCDQGCGGTGYVERLIRLSDEAVDRLAGELIKRISKRLDPHLHPLRNARY